MNIAKIQNRGILSFALQSILGSAILALSAQITIPLPFVPITGQTLGLISIAYLFGAKTGLSSVILYILEGMAGMPVFAGFAGGLHILFGTTGGYILGFIPAVFIMGHLFETANKSIVSAFLISILGQSIVLAFDASHHDPEHTCAQCWGVTSYM